MRKLFGILLLLILTSSLVGCNIAGKYDTGQSKFDNFNGTDNPTNYLDNDLITNSPAGR